METSRGSSRRSHAPGRRRRIGRLVAFGLAVVIGYGALQLAGLLRIGAGLAAGHLCSGVFVAGRPADAVRREELGDLHPLFRLVPAPVLAAHSRSAEARPFFAAPVRRAVWREGFGCAVLPPGAPADAGADLPSVPLPAWSGDPARLPWPDGDLIVDAPWPPEVDAPRLRAAVDAAFEDPRYAPSTTIGVVVVHRGRIVAERYRPGFGIETPYRTWSTAKSFTNALVGIAVARGLLTLDAPAPISAWQAPGDERREITVRQLLQMSSGLASEGDWTPEAYWGGIDSARAAASAPLESEPGTRWKYSNYDTLLLVRAIEDALGDRDAYLRFPHEALFQPLGMRHTVPETDPFGHFVLSSQVYTTPRDLARFGLLFLQDGIWNGDRLLPPGWVAFSREVAPASRQLPVSHRAHAGYGAQFWLIGRDPRLPDDVYSTGGARGQYASIVPSRHTVIVRMGLDRLRGSGWDQPGFVADVLAAIDEPSE